MVTAVLVTITGVALLLAAVVRSTLEDLPDVGSLEQYVPPLVTNVTDTNGQAVGEFFTERRTTVPLTEIPVDLRKAVMAIEDTEFYDHWGINPRAIVRAAANNLLAGRVVQGGSTLTQQLAKTIFLTREKTLDRKFKELLLTLQIERRYSKDEILQLYLNQIYFGAGAYGVEAAARWYFGKRAPNLNLAECALLAGLVRSPNRYSPVTDADRAKDRRATVLRRMRELGFITEAEEKEADGEPISNVALGRKEKEAHYFLEEVRQELAPKYGEERLEQGGLQIRTTLDVKFQRAAERILEEHLANFDITYGTAALKEYNDNLLKNTTEQVEISTTPPVIQGALIAMDVHTGAIRAMVGGRDFKTSQFNRARQAKRQPGSSFKPFIYAAALESNFTAATVVDDYPLVYIDVESDPTLLAEATTYAQVHAAILDNLQMTDTDLAAMKEDERKETLKKFWRPQNFDGKFMGPLTLRRGLQMSRNLISIRIIDSIGPRAVVRLAKAAGIRSWLNPVLSLALGTSVVSLEELTNAYGTLATGGLHADPYLVERVTDRRGNILEETVPKVESRINPQTAFLITSLMKGVVERGTGYYARRLGRPLAGKTGTTQDQRDLLFVGFSPDIVCGVWVGYDDFRPLKKGLTASAIAVPLWTDVMREAFRGQPPRDFPVPSKIEFAKIDADTGYLALPTCPKVILESFKEGTVPTEFCPYEHLSGESPDKVDTE
jgi:penicillin-binding protein 1A